MGSGTSIAPVEGAGPHATGAVVHNTDSPADLTNQIKRKSHVEETVQASLRHAGGGGNTGLDLDRLLALREYVNRAFEEDMEKDKTPKASARLRKAAAAFIAYLLDMLDFERLRESKLKEVRGDTIIKKYFVNDSDSKLPLSRTLVEATLFIMETEKVGPDKAMQAIKDEAFTFLVTEVIPFWEANQGPYGPKALSSSGTLCATLRSTGKSSSKEARSSLIEFISDPDQRDILREYLSHLTIPGVSDLLFFFMEKSYVIIMKKALVKRACMPAGMREGELENCSKLMIMRLNKLYDRYLFIGSPVRTLMTAEELMDVMGSAEELSEMNTTLMDVVLDRARTILLEITTDFMEDTPSRENISTIRQRRLTKTQKAMEYLTSDADTPGTGTAGERGQLSKRDEPTTSLRGKADNKPATEAGKPTVEAEASAPKAEKPTTTPAAVIDPPELPSPKPASPLRLMQARSASMPLEDSSGGMKGAKLGGSQSPGVPSSQSLPLSTSAPGIPASPSGGKQKQAPKGGEEEAPTMAVYLIQLEMSRQRLLVLMEGKDLSKGLKQVFLNNNVLHYLHFWREVEEYKHIPVAQVIFIQSRAEKIFEKYFRRGSSTEIYVPEETRNSILVGVLFADQHVYNAAQTIAVTYLLTEFVNWEHTSAAQGGPLSNLEELDVFNQERSSRISSPREESGKKELPISFDELLTVPGYCNYFKNFAEQEFCLETVLFWGDIQESKRLPRSDLMVSNMRKINNKYIKAGATTRPVRISSAAREQATERLANNPGPTTFSMAEAEVSSFLKTVLLPKFLKSREYASLEMYLRDSGRVPDMKTSGRYTDDMLNGSRLRVFPSPSSPASHDSLGNSNGNGNKTSARRGSPALGTNTNGKATPANIMERALRSLLLERGEVKLFFDYCCSKKCEEYVLFWLDAEDFKNVPGTDFGRLRARKMAGQYLLDTAKNPIEMPGEIREEVLKNLDRATPTIFVRAQEAVMGHLLRTVFPAYLESPEYKRTQARVEQYNDVGDTFSL